MDHIGKALEKAQSNPDSVRDWMKPVRPASPSSPAGGPPPAGQTGAQRQSAAPRPPTEAQRITFDRQRLYDNKVITLGTESSPIIDRYRLLRTRVQQIMKPRGWNVLGITSSTPEAGKTLTTINLSMVFAQAENHHVFMIDADLRKPSVSSVLGFEPEFGLADLLQQQVSLAEVTYQPTDLPNLSIIPGRGRNDVENPSELLNSVRFARLIRELGGNTQNVSVIVDTPPIQLGDDVLAAAPALDCFLLVLEEGITTVDEVNDAASLLADRNLIGTVLNKSSEKPQKFENYYGARSER